jgi:hypothetical protein
MERSKVSPAMELIQGSNPERRWAEGPEKKGPGAGKDRRCPRPDANMDKLEQNKRYLEEIKRLIEQDFFGKITVSMEKGRIVILKMEQTIKF